MKKDKKKVSGVTPQKQKELDKIAKNISLRLGGLLSKHINKK